MHVMGRDDVYPVRMSKVGCHCEEYSICFGRFLRPSSGVLKTVVAATGACHGSGSCISSKDVQGRLPAALCDYAR